MKLSKQVNLYSKSEKDILEYFGKKEVNVGNVAEYAATFGTPLYVIYYFLLKSGSFSEENSCNVEEDMVRLCKFYSIKVDI